ncbi:hypothetical protein P7C73_g4786, partial [Tremellales sp. Uapishka_1]
MITALPRTTSLPGTPSLRPNAPSPFIPSSTVTIETLLEASPHHTRSTSGSGIDVDDLDIPTDLDLRLPISQLLKLGTERAHVKAEHSAGANALVKGGLELEEYIRWLVVLWRIYDALELALDMYSTSPILAPTYDPSLLSRSAALSSDISHLLTLLPASSPSTPSRSTYRGKLPPFPVPPFLEDLFAALPPPLEAYLSHIHYLAASLHLSSGLLAHAYVRYLGDLSGGQYIGMRVRKSYGLPGNEGVRFYQFDLGGEEGRVDVRRRLGEIKDWYRRGMDEGVGDDQELKAHLIKEANLAFMLNTHLFSLIRPSPKPETSTRTNTDTTVSTSGYASRWELFTVFIVAAVAAWGVGMFYGK